MPNRLAGESSPYLLQHKENPVDWYPWGAEALEKARREDKPIFLSIGYAACHWCHVMEHESFENEAIARTLNERFVSIKVDREERPDLDQVYMNAVQMMTGRGGWPMSMFLTPRQQPFFGGTYWPPEAKMGMPGFPQVLAAVADAWQNRREQALEQAAQITRHLQTVSAPVTGGEEGGELGPRTVHDATAHLERSFDFTHGGFGTAPKFPHAMDLKVLLRAWRRDPKPSLLEMVRLNLDKMAAGGIYDHLGGGFARYSVDERWLVPHFEKMLYDNALLAGVYLEGYQATGDENYARVARETIGYVLRDMTDSAGGFHGTEDADSEGEEGKFYVWTPDEVTSVLGEEAARTFCYVYDVSDEGNFEGQSILNLPKTIEQCATIRGRDADELRSELTAGREKLLAVRNRRVRPGRDDKVLVSWNALMIDTLAQAAGVLGEPRYLEAASRAADFILGTMRRGDGRLLHTWRGGTAKLDAYLDDYAAVAGALVSLYEAGFDERRIDQAVELAELMLEHFHDERAAGFFYTAGDHEPLIARTKDLQDGSVPSGNGMAATVLVRLGKLTGESRYLEAARRTLSAGAGMMLEHPTAAGQLLLALDMLQGPTPEVVVLGDPHQGDTAAALADLRRRFIPNKVVAARPASGGGTVSPSLESIFAGKQVVGDEPTVFVCEQFTCGAPVSGKAAAIAAWGRL